MQNRFFKISKERFILFFVVAVSIYALYLRLMKLAHHNFSVDEAFQINACQVTSPVFLKSLPTLDFYIYLIGDFFLVYPFVRMFSPNKWGMALPHIAVTIIGFYVFFLICRKYFKTIFGYLIAFGILTFNATLIYHATEIRAYAVLPTIALVSFYFCQLLIEQNVKMSLINKFLIGIFFVTTILFHGLGILIVFCPLIYSLLTKINENSFKVILKDTLKFFFFVLCITTPIWIYSVFGPHIPYNGDSSVFYYIPNPLNDFFGFFKGIFGNLVGFKKFYILLIGLIIPLVFNYSDRLKQLLFLAICVFLPIGMILVSDIIHNYWFIQRQFIWVMPLFAFCLGWVWDSLFQQVRDIFLKKGISTVVPINKT